MSGKSRASATGLRILAIDPGNTRSGYVIGEVPRVDSQAEAWAPGSPAMIRPGILEKGSEWNPEFHAVLRLAAERQVELVLLETPRPRGMPTSSEEMETLLWIGRIVEQALQRKLGWSIVFRQDVKMFLCQSSTANDSNIRRSLYDHYGGEAVAVGGKRCKCFSRKTRCGTCHDGLVTPAGPLHDADSHALAAVAVLTWWAHFRTLRVRIVDGVEPTDAMAQAPRKSREGKRGRPWKSAKDRPAKSSALLDGS